MTSQDIINYIEQDLKCEVRHDPRRLLRAAHQVAWVYELDEWSVLRFILANEPITDAKGYYLSHSCGFHTRYGREIVDLFANWYNTPDKVFPSIHMN